MTMNLEVGHKNKILIVDDEEGVRKSLEVLLEDEYETISVDCGKKALKVLENKSVNVILLDINLPDIDGIELLSRIKELIGETEVIMLSALNSAQKAVDSLRLGAFDYITKPFEADDLLASVKRVIDRQLLKREVDFLREELDSYRGPWDIISKDRKMLEVKGLIKKVAMTTSSVLITGESGTGKEMVARAIHFYSERKNAPFVAVNCGAIPSELVESELFGHERGAFTGAAKSRIGKFEFADGGTLFLDEISTLPAILQVKLLRVLQENMIEKVGSNRSIKIDVKIIAATNSDLKKEIKKGNFRSDLFFRLNILPVCLPSLREKRDDIPLLAHHFLRRFRKQFNKKVLDFSPDVLEVMRNYHWPGNVRELKNLVERMVVLSTNKTITIRDLPAEVFSTDRLQSVAKERSSLKDACQLFERQFILDSLKKFDWNQTKTAQHLKVHRNTLLEKMKNLGIRVKKSS